jgi:hypothetical protein
MSDSKFDQMRGDQPKKSDAFQAQSEFAGVCRELFNLLEAYAPLWYTEEHHNRAVAALRIRSQDDQGSFFVFRRKAKVEVQYEA